MNRLTGPHSGTASPALVSYFPRGGAYRLEIISAILRKVSRIGHAVETQQSNIRIFYLHNGGGCSRKNGVIQWSPMAFHAFILSSRVYVKAPKHLLNPVCLIVFLIVSNLGAHRQH